MSFGGSRLDTSVLTHPLICRTAVIVSSAPTDAPAGGSGMGGATSRVATKTAKMTAETVTRTSVPRAVQCRGLMMDIVTHNLAV